MNISIRLYDQSDKDSLIHCLEELSDYLSPMDPITILRRLPRWGKKYTHWLLNAVKKQDGAIFVALDDHRVIGVIAVVVVKITKLDQLSITATKMGRVLELFVHEPYRRHGVGKLLINHAENHLHGKHCEFVRIEVFEPNTSAHNFYQSLGYTDRLRDMIKKI
ncbi:MAG: GNAT family N-acetyltransferase [Candidatus Gottesmanbacteria bacterium]|nr:GNAT family N-acetyltransferase [Candidatus Gottesmanbacteria bacterium]